MDTTTYVTIARADSIPHGAGRAFPVLGRMIAVFRVGDTFHAIDDSCPHMGASLADGHVEEGTVTCPWHAWRFRVSDGTWCDNPKIKIDAFPVRRDGEYIQIGIPSAAP